VNHFLLILRVALIFLVGFTVGLVVAVPSKTDQPKPRVDSRISAFNTDDYIWATGSSISASTIGVDEIDSAETAKVVTPDPQACLDLPTEAFERIAVADQPPQTVNDALDGILRDFESTPEFKRMTSRKVLEDRRCYVFNDGSYQCWLPDGVCDFRMPDGMAPDVERSGSISCRGYTQLEPVTP
jgi:hypothetical protein